MRFISFAAIAVVLLSSVVGCRKQQVRLERYKIDKPDANPDRVREELSAMNILVEEWGGKYQCQEISAKKGTNIDELLEKVLLEAELLELKANPQKNAVGTL